MRRRQGEVLGQASHFLCDKGHWEHSGDFQKLEDSFKRGVLTVRIVNRIWGYLREISDSGPTKGAWCVVWVASHEGLHVACYVAKIKGLWATYFQTRYLMFLLVIQGP